MKLLPIVVLILLIPSAFAAEDRVVIHPLERAEAIANPMKGWVIWAENDIHPPQPTSLFFALASWNELEPVEGEYAFDRWEERDWTRWTAQGMKAIFRIYVDYPGRPIGLPQWLVDAGVTLWRYEDHGGGWSPDYENPLFIEKVKRFIAALGARYDADPRVAFLDVGILGYWGEWHTYPNTSMFASVPVQHEVAQAFLDAFPTKKKMLRTPSLWSARRAFGYRDDCFLSDTDGPEDWKFFPMLRSTGANDVWQSQPFGGEFCGGGEGAREGTLNQADECLRLVREGHFSHLGPAGGTITAQGEEHQRNLDTLLKAMGYRFVIREAIMDATFTSHQNETISLTIENTGSAPFYYSWPLEICLLDGEHRLLHRLHTDVDVTQWLPGTHTFDVQIEVPDLSVALNGFVALRLADPSENGMPVRFANQGEEVEGAFVLGLAQFATNTSVESWESDK